MGDDDDDDVWDLFDENRLSSSEQEENLDRVRAKIAPVISAFYHEHGINTHFHVDELRRYVAQQYPNTAPDSAGRIMRYMREHGWINYTVVNRRASLYRITGLGNENSRGP